MADGVGVEGLEAGLSGCLNLVSFVVGAERGFWPGSLVFVFELVGK